MTIEESNSDRIGGVFMNPTGNYHMPVKYFLESNGYYVCIVDAMKTKHLRMIQNLVKEKSDPEVASILASDLAAVFPEYNHTFEIDS